MDQVENFSAISDIVSREASQKMPEFLYWEISKNQCYSALLWTGGFFLLTGLMVLTVKPLFYEYYDNNVGTRMEVVPRNETITAPKLTFCIPYSPRSLETIAMSLRPRCTKRCRECKRLEKNGFLNMTTLKDNIASYGDVIVDKWNVASFLYQEFKRQGNFSYLDPSNADWNQPIVEAIWDVFTCIGGMDNSSATSMHPCTRRYDVQRLLTQKSVVEKLWNMLVALLSQHVEIEGVDYERNTTIQKFFTGHMFADYFCFKLSSGLVQDGLTIRVDSRSRRGSRLTALEDVSKPFVVFYGSGVILWPLGDPERSYALITSETGRPEIAHGHESVILKYLVQSSIYEKKKIQCYKEPTPGDCLANCKDEKRIQCYKCIPFTFRKGARAVATFENSPDTPFCNDTFYSKAHCGNFKTECNRQCVSPCKYINYQWVSTSTLVAGPSSRQFTLKILSIESPFIRFELVERQTFEQFASSIAGFVNLFLGFSGATIVGLLIQLIVCFKNWKAEQENRQGEVGNSSTHIDLAGMDRQKLREMEVHMGRLEHEMGTLKKQFGK